MTYYLRFPINPLTGREVTAEEVVGMIGMDLGTAYNTFGELTARKIILQIIGGMVGATVVALTYEGIRLLRNSGEDGTKILVALMKKDDEALFDEGYSDGDVINLRTLQKEMSVVGSGWSNGHKVGFDQSWSISRIVLYEYQKWQSGVDVVGQQEFGVSHESYWVTSSDGQRVLMVWKGS